MRQEAARAAREEDKRRKDAERERKLEQRQRQEAHVRKQQQSAAQKTETAERRVEEINTILATALAGSIGRLDFDRMKTKPAVVPLDLGHDAQPVPAPQWEQSAPKPLSAFNRMFGGQRRYERDKKAADQSFATALQQHAADELARQQRVVTARDQHSARLREEHARVAEQHQAIDELRRRFLARDRHAVSTCFQRVLDTIPEARDFPRARRAGYVPESTLLAIEWELPPVKIIPVEKEFVYVKTRDAVEVRKSRPVAEIRQIYQNLVAQIALRALHAVFQADRESMVETVVFNGVVEDVDPANGQKIRPCLITLRATREHFNQVNLQGVDPVKCVRQHFAADVSPHPEELAAVAPVLSFDMADPRIIDAVDVLSDIDQRPNLLEMSPKAFEHFVQNLFTRMGFDTKLFKADGDGGVDCVAYDPTPIRGGKYVIQVKLYTKTVPPSAVRDLYGVVQHEGATKGILITTSGFGPSSHEFANGKPLQLYDGHNLLALCHEHGIQARILHTAKTRKRTK